MNFNREIPRSVIKFPLRLLCSSFINSRLEYLRKFPPLEQTRSIDKDSGHKEAVEIKPIKSKESASALAIYIVGEEVERKSLKTVYELSLFSFVAAKSKRA